MDLKEFVKETISAIADATIELQEEYQEKQVLVNPPAAQSGADVYQEGSPHYTFRRVRDVKFDVALTAVDEASGGGTAALKVLSIELGGKGNITKSQEQVSRVMFSIPIALRPTDEEAFNKGLKAEQDSLPVTVPNTRRVRL